MKPGEDKFRGLCACPSDSAVQYVMVRYDLRRDQAINEPCDCECHERETEDDEDASP